MVSIAWSSPGLAKHRRCALGVLTANHVLSMWESDSDPKDERNWKRSMIVNGGLERYLASFVPAEERSTYEGSEIQKRKSRIRAFGWSRACHMGIEDPWGIQLLALSNDDNEIAIARVRSLSDTYSRDSADFSAHFLGRLEVNRGMNGSSDPCIEAQSARRRVMNATRFANNLAWSPWLVTAKRRRMSFLAYVAGGRVHIAIVHLKQLEEKASGGNQEFSLALDIGKDVFSLAKQERLRVSYLKWHDQVQKCKIFERPKDWPGSMLSG